MLDWKEEWQYRKDRMYKYYDIRRKIKKNG